jgi:hypothetical protein
MEMSGQHHATRPRFTPGERTPGTHWIGGWVGPRAGLDEEARRKKSSASVGDRTPVVQSVVSHYTDWATPAPRHKSRWNNNIKMYHKLGYEDVNWIHLTRDWVRWREILNTILNLRFHKSGLFLDQQIVTYLTKALHHGINWTDDISCIFMCIAFFFQVRLSSSVF